MDNKRLHYEVLRLHLRSMWAGKWRGRIGLVGDNWGIEEGSAEQDLD